MPPLGNDKGDIEGDIEGDLEKEREERRGESLDGRYQLYGKAKEGSILARRPQLASGCVRRAYCRYSSSAV